MHPVFSRLLADDKLREEELAAEGGALPIPEAPVAPTAPTAPLPPETPPPPGSNMPVLKTTTKPIQKKDRTNHNQLSQALYSAFADKPLSDGFFSRDEDQEDKQMQREYMRQALMAKHAPKEKAPDKGDDGGSNESMLFRRLVVGSPEGKAMRDRVEAENPGAWDAMPKNHILALLKDGKQLLVNDSNVMKEGEKGVRLGSVLESKKIIADDANAVKVQLGELGAVTKTGLQDDQQEFLAPQNELDRASRERAAAAKSEKEAAKFSASQDDDVDEMVIQWNKNIPKGLGAAYKNTVELESLVTGFGGEDKVPDVGIFVGAKPKTLLDKKALEFQARAQAMANDYFKSEAGTAVSASEEARIQKAIGGIDGRTSLQQVMMGVKLLKERVRGQARQSLAGLAGSPKGAKAFNRIRAGWLSGDEVFDPKSKAVPESPLPKLPTFSGSVSTSSSAKGQPQVDALSKRNSGAPAPLPGGDPGINTDDTVIEPDGASTGHGAVVKETARVRVYEDGYREAK